MLDACWIYGGGGGVLDAMQSYDHAAGGGVYSIGEMYAISCIAVVVWP